MGRIAQDSPKDHWTIMEIISSYVREKSPKYASMKTFEVEDLKKLNDSTQDKKTEDEKIKADIQAALTIIGRRISKHDSLAGNRIDLSDTHLLSADFRRAYLVNIDFRLARLSGADFIQADLRYADFRYADLRLADFKDANLYLADFANADLRSTENVTFEQLEKAIINEETKLSVEMESRRQELLEASRRKLEKLKNAGVFP